MKQLMEQLKVGEPVIEQYLEMLNELRESGVTNMFGAVPYIIEDFPELTQLEAKAVLVYWMKNFKGETNG